MRFLADENVPQSLVTSLRTLGQSVVRMRDRAPGAPDHDVLRLAAAENLVLLTEDNDFGELIFGRGAIAYAVVMIRFAQFPGEIAQFAPKIAARVCDMESELVGHLTIIEPARTRRRAFSGGSVDRD